jgi:hypothetical protein
MTAVHTNASAAYRRGWRIAAALLAAALLALGVSAWWASEQGYVSWFGTDCTDEGYNPIPSYEELVSNGKSPYCARLIREEAWF